MNNLNKTLLPLSNVEEDILKRFEADTHAERRLSRLLLEHARNELQERARQRGDWSLVRELIAPTEDSRAERMLEHHISLIYEEISD